MSAPAELLDRIANAIGSAHIGAPWTVNDYPESHATVLYRTMARAAYAASGAEAVAVPLAADHQNLKVSAAGLLKRCAEIVEKSRDGKKLGYGYVLRDELLKHLEQVAERYYAGEIAVVDEFLQLYCLGEDAHKAAKVKMPKEEATAPQFLIFSVVHSQASDHAVFWRHNGSGYTIDVKAAGRFTADKAQAVGKSTHCDNVGIPEAEVLALSSMHVIDICAVRNHLRKAAIDRYVEKNTAEKCLMDTDGDGKCHLCANAGGCEKWRATIAPTVGTPDPKYGKS